MSLFKSLENLIRQKSADAEKAIADPVANGRFAIEDSKKEVEKFTAKIADLIAETKRLERERDAAQTEVSKWTAISEKAAEAGNESDVTMAVQNKQSAESRLNALQQEIARNEKLTADLREKLDKVRAQIAAAESDLAQLAARQEGAKIREELAKASDSFGSGGSPISALGDLRKNVEAEESKAEALEEISQSAESASAQSLEEKYSGAASSVNDEVARLMEAAKAKKSEGDSAK